MFRSIVHLRTLKLALPASFLALYPAAARAQSDVYPRDVVAVLEQVSDIDKLRVLNPLKLTTDELDRLITTVKKSQDSYNKALADAASPAMREIADDVKATRAKMLSSGGGVPKSFDDKVKRVQDDMIAKRRTLDATALKGLSDDIRAILTPTQVKTAVSLARTLSESDGKPTAKGTDAQFFNYYVLGTFIQYSRIVTVLEDMKKAGGTAAAVQPARRIARSPVHGP